MIRTEMDALAATLARILIGGFFALSGANNLLDIGLASKRAAEAGVPIAPVFIFVIAFFKLLLGILIMIKHHTKIAAFFVDKICVENNNLVEQGTSRFLIRPEWFYFSGLIDKGSGFRRGY